MQTTNVADVVNDCAFVLTLLSEAFGTFPSPGSSLTLSYGAQTGLSLLLDQASSRLFDAGEALSNNQKVMEVQP